MDRLRGFGGWQDGMDAHLIVRELQLDGLRILFSPPPRLVVAIDRIGDTAEDRFMSLPTLDPDKPIRMVVLDMPDEDGALHAVAESVAHLVENSGLLGHLVLRIAHFHVSRK